MDIQKVGANRIIKTIIATGILLLVFFLQNAVVVVNGLKGIESAVVQDFVLWGFVLITIVFLLHKTQAALFAQFSQDKLHFS